MSTRAVIALAFALILGLLAMLVVEVYRECREAGYTDCPRIGKQLFNRPKPGDITPKS
jgi:hypothetical protein